jgi:hypothetical protein
MPPLNLIRYSSVNYSRSLVRNLAFSIFSCSKAAKAKLAVTDLEILVVLVTRLLRQDLGRLVNGMEPVEPWDEG